MSTRKGDLIQKINAASNETGDLLLDFMELHNLDNLMTAKVEQLEQYIADRG